MIELATGDSHGPFDSEAEAVAELAFAGLSFDEVEIVNDAPVTARYAAWVQLFLVRRRGHSGVGGQRVPCERPGERREKGSPSRA